MRNHVYRAVGSALFVLNRACAWSPALQDFCIGADDPDGPKNCFYVAFRKTLRCSGRSSCQRRPPAGNRERVQGKCLQVSLQLKKQAAEIFWTTLPKRCTVSRIRRLKMNRSMLENDAWGLSRFFQVRRI